MHQVKLGLLPTTTPDERLLKLKWRTAPVAYPATIDNLTGVTLALDGNDQFGDCGPTSVDNHNRVTTLRYGTENDAALADVFELYRASGNPDFNPATGAGDNGVAMDVMMQALRSQGLGGKKIIAFGKLADLSLASIRTAIALFGAVLFAVDLQTAQQTQTASGYWDYQPSGVWGGHAICAAAYDAQSIDVVSWAQRIHCSPAFLTHQLSEVWVPIWPEVAQSDRFNTFVDAASLAADYTALTDQPWPGSNPSPTPPPIAPPQLTVTDSAILAHIAHAAGLRKQTSQEWLNAHLNSYFK